MTTPSWKLIIGATIERKSDGTYIVWMKYHEKDFPGGPHMFDSWERVEFFVKKEFEMQTFYSLEISKEFFEDSEASPDLSDCRG